MCSDTDEGVKGKIDMGNLDLIITHYKEPFAVGEKLFDSIAMQRMVNFENVGVILVHDGEENALPDECFEGYPFKVRQIPMKKGGVSKARNTGLDASEADWVMFCDFDDCFSNLFGLYMIFCAMAEGKYDTIWSCFTEETVDGDGNLTIVHHERDWVFIHGKAHNRAYLVENNIRFNERLTIHEDAYFTILTQSLCKEGRIGGIKTPFYLWAWNANSVVRKDKAEDYVLDTYDHLIRQRMALTQEFLDRGMYEQALSAIVKTVCDCYYDCQQVTWRDPKNLDKLHKAENWFAAYLKKYAGYYAKADSKIISTIAGASRTRTLKKGTFFVEFETMKEWIQHIIETAKPIPAWELNV